MEDFIITLNFNASLISSVEVWKDCVDMTSHSSVSNGPGQKQITVHLTDGYDLDGDEGIWLCIETNGGAGTMEIESISEVET